MRVVFVGGGERGGGCVSCKRATSVCVFVFVCGGV